MTRAASLCRELALVLHVIGKGAPAAPYECCQPGQGGEKRNKGSRRALLTHRALPTVLASILPFRWRPRDADHIRWPFCRRTDDAGLRSVQARAIFCNVARPKPGSADVQAATRASCCSASPAGQIGNQWHHRRMVTAMVIKGLVGREPTGRAARSAGRASVMACSRFNCRSSRQRRCAHSSPGPF
jgi:hypothetical protein